MHRGILFKTHCAGSKKLRRFCYSSFTVCTLQISSGTSTLNQKKNFRSSRCGSFTVPLGKYVCTTQKYIFVLFHSIWVCWPWIETGIRPWTRWIFPRSGRVGYTWYVGILKGRIPAGFSRSQWLVWALERGTRTTLGWMLLWARVGCPLFQIPQYRVYPPYPTRYALACFKNRGILIQRVFVRSVPFRRGTRFRGKKEEKVKGSDELIIHLENNWFSVPSIRTVRINP